MAVSPFAYARSRRGKPQHVGLAHGTSLLFRKQRLGFLCECCPLPIELHRLSPLFFEAQWASLSTRFMQMCCACHDHILCSCRLCCDWPGLGNCVRSHWRPAGDAFFIHHGRAYSTAASGNLVLALRSRPLAQIASHSMTRSQRSLHRTLWPLLALALAIGLALALILDAPA